MQSGNINKIKTIEIVAGPNGSGKTTFAESYLFQIKKNLIFLNPDIIASGISPLAFDQASFQAGRVLITEIKDRIRREQNFAFESTLSGKTWIPILTRARKDGYQIIIYFLFLDSVKKNLQRISDRVSLGGHNIPKEAVLRRQPRCFDNFWRLYRPIADDWYVFDNSKIRPKLLASKFDFEKASSEAQAKFESNFRKGRVYGVKQAK